MEQLLHSIHIDAALLCGWRVCKDVEILIRHGDCGGCAQEASADGHVLCGHKQCGPNAAAERIELGMR